MSSTQILKCFMVAAFFLLIIANLSVVAEPEYDNYEDKQPSTANDATFVDLDANNDGKISLKEAIRNKALINGFSNADSDTDGMVTAEEFRVFRNNNETNE